MSDLCPKCGINIRKCINTDACEARALRAQLATVTRERDSWRLQRDEVHAEMERQTKLKHEERQAKLDAMRERDDWAKDFGEKADRLLEVIEQRDEARADAARLREALERMLRRHSFRAIAGGCCLACENAEVVLASAPSAEPSQRDTLNAPQPPPTSDDAGPEVWPSLLSDVKLSPELRALCKERDAMGRAKYGTALRVHNGREPLVDALQEALDLAVYLHQAALRAGEFSQLQHRRRLRNRALDLAQALLDEVKP